MENKGSLTKRIIGLGIALAVLTVMMTGMAYAATNTETYGRVTATITAPDIVVANTDFGVDVAGDMIGGSPFDITAFRVYEDADWSYNANHLVDVISGNLIDGSGFHFGASYINTYIFNKPAGTYKYTFIYGYKSSGHDWYDVAVDVYVTVGDAGGEGCSNAAALEMVGDLRGYINALPDDAFAKNSDQRKNALSNKLDAVSKKIESCEGDEAKNKLQHDIRAKMDVSLGGSPKNDWITSPVSQSVLTGKIDDLLALLN